MPDKFKAGARQRLPDRRRSETRKITWQPPYNVDAPTTKIYVTIGYAEDALRPVEIFYDSGYRSGSDLETLVSDLCILLSVLLQHVDVKIESFARSLSKEIDLRTGQMEFASLVGVLIEELRRPPEWAGALQASGGETDA